MENFTPWSALSGGLLIGFSAVLLMLFEGRIAGISGIVSRLFPPYTDNRFLSRAGFVLGLLTAPFLYLLFTGALPTITVSSDPVMMMSAGLLVGFGAVLGSGCTSGHGVCGISRLSPRSLLATTLFMAAGFITVFIMRHLIG
ncbi:YeeE/YedE family protein [Pseudochrobactrum sp. sp1633]|uniref:YeeE/YedE family protein n=1 Tax=Pseudochrobactrum sp. sp1633 TaxID=3036706 RepID=UPI0025A5C626|nr:YeeE/YedE family protein [Pseudochrobactrum sp. sp1633]MDM8346372.1 YeeE/YedE family protein [Pseudochrobactrum sp. sp1633]HWD14209.1 YeeE/YedE family protein [Pseudochrobactrum sp.]